MHDIIIYMRVYIIHMPKIKQKHRISIDDHANQNTMLMFKNQSLTTLTTAPSTTTLRTPLRRSQHGESLNQPHCRPGRNTSYQNHLKPADQPASTIPRPLPATHEASLGIPENEQRNDHRQNRPAQRQKCIVGTDKEIRDQGYKTTDEVTKCNGQCTDNCSRI